MHALPWHSFPRKPWAASPLGNGLWIRIFFCRFERWTTAVCFSCQTESFVVIAIQTHIAHLVSQHPHNGHISPLLAIYNVASLTPYRCARAALRLQNEQCSCNAASWWRNLRSFNSFSYASSLGGCLCAIAWPVLFCLMSGKLLCVSPATRVTLLPSVPYSCNFQPPMVLHFLIFSKTFSIYAQRHWSETFRSLFCKFCSALIMSWLTHG